MEGVRGKGLDWREGIEKDARVSVKILFAELAATEQKLNSIYNMPLNFEHWRDRDVVETLMLETGIVTYNEAEEENI